MKLEIRDIGKIENADIELNSISVIAGYNGSGKTTISKCLYGIMEIIKKNVSLDELSAMFSNQMITFGKKNPKPSLMLSDKDGRFTISIDTFGKWLEKKEDSLEFGDPIYLRSPSRWSDLFSDNLRNLLSEPPKSNTSDLMEEYKKILERNARGTLKRIDDKYVFVDEDFPDNEISIDNTASGVMIFLELSRLIANGNIREGSVLIIDEPETNLHPEKQVVLAKVLVNIAQSLNIKLLLSSHNIYFIRALEVSLEESNLTGYKFYRMNQNAETRLFDSVDVTEDTEKIYSELYRPLEAL